MRRAAALAALLALVGCAAPQDVVRVELTSGELRYYHGARMDYYATTDSVAVVRDGEIVAAFSPDSVAEVGYAAFNGKDLTGR